MTDLKATRKTAGMTQIQLSLKARVSRYRIALAETKNLKLRPDELAAIASAVQSGLERASRLVSAFQGANSGSV
jgi:transcriptional regulator with XRE-family HTH domain